MIDLTQNEIPEDAKKIIDNLSDMLSVYCEENKLAKENTYFTNSGNVNFSTNISSGTKNTQTCSITGEEVRSLCICFYGGTMKVCSPL